MVFADHFLNIGVIYFYLLDICNGIRQGELSKNKDVERTVSNFLIINMMKIASKEILMPIHTDLEKKQVLPPLFF